jgi:peptidoglycan/LPS O-acetylase OafA/YrhL
MVPGIGQHFGAGIVDGKPGKVPIACTGSGMGPHLTARRQKNYLHVCIHKLPNPLNPAPSAVLTNPLRPAAELTGLTGLRGIAALTVFVAHSSFQELIPALRPLCTFSMWHTQAVDLFFMLSGFVLIQVYAGKLGMDGRGSWKSYFAARFARIVPLYTITLLAALAIFLMGSLIVKKWPHQITGSAVVTNLLLIQNWPGFFNGSINTPSWSLSVEVLCYLLLMPVALVLDKRIKNLGIALGLMMLLIFARVVVQESVMGWESLARGATCFLTGTLLHRFFPSKPAGRAAIVTLTGAAIFLILRSLSAWAGLAPAWPIVSFPLLVLGLASPAETIVHRFFKSRIMLWLGDISYSVYLWQAPMMMITYYQIRPRIMRLPGPVHALWFICEIALLLWLSTLSYQRIEMPLRRWLRARLDVRAA